jgi:hypothetical protein
MALTKLPKNAIGTGAVKSNNIADGTIQNQDVSGSISNDKLANSSFTINGTSVSLGASQSIIAYLDWQAVQVADGSTQVNAESGKGYFLDTNAGVIEVFLPTSPSRGDVVGLVDYAGTFGTNQLIINTGGINIDSTVGSEFKVTTNNAIIECVYVDSAKGWLIYLNQAAGTTPTITGNEIGGGYDSGIYISATGGTITTSGNFKIHTFTGDGCFVVSSLGNLPASGSTVDYMVVAGGGGGGASGDPSSSLSGAGGGAGGFRESKDSTLSSPHTTSPLAATTGITVTTTTYPITVGAGGSGAPLSNNPGTSGSNSVFSTITSAGGGGGGSRTSAPSYSAGQNGGSGGGGGAPNLPAGNAGLGNTPPTIPPQGTPGAGQGPAGNTLANPGSGGGGGATQAGQACNATCGSNGGDGTTTSISGSSTSYAGGGGSAAGSSGGLGGGGGGGPSPVAGTTNTGGGGGGGGSYASSTGSSGGKGIVIIRYKFQ